MTSASVWHYEARGDEVYYRKGCTGEGWFCTICNSFLTGSTTGGICSYIPTVTEPTCTEAGYTTHTCTRCGDTYTDTPVEALGHSFSEWMTTKEATCTEDGEQRRDCGRCDHYETQVLPELGHDYHTVVTAPTCTEQGYTTYTCRCGDSYVQDYVDGICTRCGEKDPDWVEPTDPSEPTEPSKPTDPSEPEEPADPVDPEEPVLSGVIRIAGADRIGTSLMLADQLKEVLAVEKFNSVIVASALNFPDALTGSYLAAVKEAPIFLTYPAAHSQITAYIEANLASGGTVYILGGESAVDEDFENMVTAKGLNVKRVAGSDRFGTNLAIMNEAGEYAGKPILIATALNFADSLSASAAGLPMVLVYGSLREDQKEFLATTSKNFIIIGGEAAVSPALEAELKTIGTVERLAGDGRYQTSVMVARKFVQNPDDVVLAYARNFPDGLCGGPLAYALGAPLILTDNSGYSTADTYVSGISAGIVVGGTGLISDAATRDIFDLAANAQITDK